MARHTICVTPLGKIQELHTIRHQRQATVRPVVQAWEERYWLPLLLLRLQNHPLRPPDRCVHHVSHPPTSAGEMPYSSVTYPVASNLLSSDRSLDTVTLLQVNTSFISHSPPTSSKRTSLVHAENSPGQRNTCCISVTSRLKHFDPFPPLMLPEIFDPERFGLALGLLEYTEEIRVCVKPRMTQELRLE